MYVIRATAGQVEVVFSSRVPLSEALRAVSQASAMAEAGDAQRVLCDLRAIELGPTGTDVLAAALASHDLAGWRLALVCSERQRGPAVRFARRTGVREELGVFTREDDARAWLDAAVRTSVSTTMRRHFGCPASGESPAAARERGVA